MERARGEGVLPLRDERVTIRPMTRRDVDEMQTWPRFTDPLLASSNLPRQGRAEKDVWFLSYAKGPSRRLYAIEDQDGLLIGRLSLREINGQESARLGITLRADRLDQGYGTDAIRLFLHYYFEKMGFATLYLDVAAANTRAIRCYEKCGFQQIGSHYRWAGSDAQLALLKEKRHRSIRQFFKKEKGRNLALFYDMKIERKDWERITTAEPAPLLRP